MSAAHKALSIEHVLEDVLFHLSLREIIRARLICREFCRAIDESVWIRRALFLTSTPTETVEYYDTTVVQAGDGSFTFSEGGWQTDEHSRHQDLVLNPFAVTSRDLHRLKMDNANYHITHEGLFATKGQLGSGLGLTAVPVARDLFYPSNMSAVAISAGPFRDMQLTSPPERKITLRDMKSLWHEDIDSSGCKLGKYGCFKLHFGGEDVLGVDGGKDVVILKNAIDEISGHDMLDILRQGYCSVTRDRFSKTPEGVWVWMW